MEALRKTKTKKKIDEIRLKKYYEKTEAAPISLVS